MAKTRREDAAVKGLSTALLAPLSFHAANSSRVVTLPRWKGSHADEKHFLRPILSKGEKFRRQGRTEVYTPGSCPEGRPTFYWQTLTVYTTYFRAKLDASQICPRPTFQKRWRY